MLSSEQGGRSHIQRARKSWCPEPSCEVVAGRSLSSGRGTWEVMQSQLQSLVSATVLMPECVGASLLHLVGMPRSALCHLGTSMCAVTPHALGPVIS